MAKELKAAYVPPNNEIGIDTNMTAFGEKRDVVSGEAKPAIIKLWIRYGSTRQWRTNKMAEGASLPPNNQPQVDGGKTAQA